MKILLADPSPVWCEALRNQLDDHYEVSVCSDGLNVIPMLTSFQPDLLVLGLDLPHVDGLTILRTIHTSGIAVRLLVVSTLINEYVLSMLSKFKVSSLLRKPCTVCSAVSQIYDILHYCEETSNSLDPESTLLSMGFRMHLAGFACLCTAIRLMREDPSQCITKVLYPAVAKHCGGTSQRVERAIRSSIADAWKRRNDEIWCAYFPANRANQISLPKNGDFIARIALGGKDKKACG